MTVDSRESGDTLVIKDSTDTSDKAYMPTSSDSEESIRSEPTKQMKQKKQTTIKKSFESTTTKEATKEEQPQKNIDNRSNRRLTRAMKAGRIKKKWRSKNEQCK